MCVAKKLIRPDDPPVPVDEDGKFTEEVKDYVGLLVKETPPKDEEEKKNFVSTDKKIIRDLK